MARKKDSTATQEADLAIPASMKPKIITFRLAGISPLLQNNPANFIGKTDDGALGAKKTYDDAEEARLRLYLDPEGRHYHPADAVRKAMVTAVAGRKFGKLFATKAIKGAVFTTEPFSYLEDAKGKPLEKYTIHRCSVVVGKARILRCRPMWTNWFLRVALEIDAAILTETHVRDALSLAGRIIGIGDSRPEKGGGFGRFTVE